MEFKSTWKRVGLGVVSLASAALLAACGNSSSSSSSSNEINWYTPTEILTLDISKIPINIQRLLSEIHQVTYFV